MIIDYSNLRHQAERLRDADSYVLKRALEAFTAVATPGVVLDLLDQLDAVLALHTSEVTARGYDNEAIYLQRVH